MPSFAASTLLDRLAALAKEIKGVRRNKDPEYIHRMRVAARRLRTALNLFADDFPGKKWRKPIRKLAAALGEARDADVQIEFLKQCLARAEPRQRPGLRRLLLRLRQHRAGLQAGVTSALDKFEKRKVAGRLRAALTRNGPDSVSPDLQSQVSSLQSPNSSLQLPASALPTLIQAVLDFDQPVRDSANSAELHALRIACKRLRYALEIFAPLFPEPDRSGPSEDSRLAPYVKIVKTFQEILGDLHDCDVWIARLPEFVKDETRRALDYFGHTRSIRTLEPGLNFLRDERAYHRAVRYHEFLDLWQAHLDAGTWPNLLALIQSVPSVPSSPSISAEPTCIALIGDIHANLPALEAVLAHARERSAQAVWNIGDLVGYGPHPDEVVQLLKREGVLSLGGNYDLKVLQVKKRKEKWTKTKQPEKLLAFEWAYDHLSPESRDYLRALPTERRLSLHGWRILLTHASPASNEEALTPDTPDQRLRALAQPAEADLIVFGHSHQPFARQVDGVWFVNTGSVGRPDDGDPRAAYALLHLAPGSLEVSHHRVDYDIQRTVAAVHDHGLPDSFARIFLHGRSLDDLVTTG